MLDRSYGVRWDLSGLIDNATVYSRALDAVVSGDLLIKSTQWLESQGFSRYDNPAASDHTYLNGSGVICTLGVGYPGMLLNCGYIGWFDSKAAEFSNQVAVSSGFEEGAVLQINPENLKIKDSAYAPYQTMIAYGPRGGTMFYRTSPDEPWQWFQEWTTQAVTYCGDYNTDDLKRAFLGDICWFEGGTSQVEL